MTRIARPLMIGLFSGLALLVLAGPSYAQYRGYRGGVFRRSAFPPNRMPGWDWWRIYPYSPYNYGRNPYNPIVYPYVAPYPVYSPYYAPPVTYNATPPEAEPAYGAADSAQQVLVPHPTGGVTTPPADAAVIRLYIPDRFGQVSFDQVKTSSIGTTRYYVTPSLPGDRPLTYVVTANFNRDGQAVSEERTVKVSPGKTSVVDFNKSEKAAAK
jgi:uncharacterized protein (TIGR03000 family)